LTSDDLPPTPALKKRRWFRLPIVFQLANATHWRDAGNWLLYTLFGGLIPFWGTALILLFVQRSQPFTAYFAGGELAVFCAGLLSSAIPVMRRRIKDAPVEHPDLFHFVSLLCLAVILMLFASVTLARQFSLPALNQAVIVTTSFVLFAVSVLMGFFVEVINNVRMTPADVKRFEVDRAVSLETAFEQARSEQRE
jgi:hypothetical protein